MNNQQQLNVNIDIKATQPITNEDNKQLFQEGVLLRKVSKFVAGTPEDAIVPVPCFYEPTTGKILIEMLPKELREEYIEYNKNISS